MKKKIMLNNSVILNKHLARVGSRDKLRSAVDD